MSIVVRDKAGNRTKVAGMGLPGPAGKSAYQYAAEGGFTGTEAEFASLMGVRSNQNLLDNSYWASKDAIINQRGQEEYAQTGQLYSIDRWKYHTDPTETPLKIDTNGIAFSCLNESPESYIEQFVEQYDCYRGQTLTFSVLGQFTGQCKLVVYGEIDGNVEPPIASLSFDADGELSLKTIAFIMPDEDMPWFKVRVTAGSGASVASKAAKLELGPVQTLAHQDADGNWVLNDPPPNKALELAKCQEYCINLVHAAKADDFLCVGSGLASELNLVPVFIPLPVPLRAAPAVNFAGDWRLVKDGYWEQGVAVAGISAAYLSGNGITLWVSCTGNSLEIGKIYYLCGSGGSPKSLLLSSDL